MSLFARYYKMIALVFLNTILIAVAFGLLINRGIVLNFFFPESFEKVQMSIWHEERQEIFFEEWMTAYGDQAEAVLEKIYPGKTREEIKKLWTDTSVFQDYEPFVVWRQRPILGTVYGSTHEAGFRLIGQTQAAWPPVKERFSIFMFGGSTGYGTLIDDHETIAAHLQTELRDIDMPVDVYNFGAPGYFSTQERILFQQLILKGYRPDLVIFFDGLNDAAYWKGLPPHVDFLKNAYSYLQQWNDRSAQDQLKSLFFKMPAVKVISEALTPDTDPLKSALGDLPPEYDEAHISDPVKVAAITARMQNNFQQAHSVAKEFAGEAVQILQPTPFYKYPKSLWHNMEYSGEHWRGTYLYPEFLRQMSARPEGFVNVYSCANLFENATEKKFVDHVHYTGAASKEIAKCIAGKISKFIKN